MTPPADTLPTHYRLADLTLDVARRCVTRQGQPIELKALDFDLLRFLVESAPNVVNADVLAEKVWGRHFVSPENVAQRVMLLRQSLSDDANRPRYIETIRNRGYRLIPVAETVPAGEAVGTRRRRWPIAAAAVLLLGVGVTGAVSYWLAGEPRAPASPSSVAVLPFENLTPEPDYAHFAAGMQDEIVSQLTKLRALSVIPVRPGDAPRASIPEVVRGLDVATVLEGSVYYAEGRVRVTPRLTEVATRKSLWSDSYERELSDFFAIHSEIALEVARALSLELSAAERERIERVPTIDPRARDLYLMARVRDPYSSPEGPTAIAEVEEALALDPEFKEAWVLDAHLRCAAQNYDLERLDEHLSLGEQAARRALVLDPDLGGAYATLGEILQAKKDWTGAEAAFQKAMHRNVPVAEMGGYAMLQLYAGKFSPFARDLFEKARAAAPQGETMHRFLAFIHEGRGEWARANELYDLGIGRFEGDDATVSRMLNQRMHWLVGRNELEEARALTIADPLNAAMLESLDDPQRALAELRHAYEATIRGYPNRRRDIGLWAGHYGDPVLALDAMRAATDERAVLIAYAWLPQLASMRRLPEFKEYLREIGMVDYWKEYGWPAFCEEIDEHDFECH